VQDLINHPVGGSIGAYAGAQLFKHFATELLGPWANDLLGYFDIFGYDPNVAPVLGHLAMAPGFHVGASVGGQIEESIRNSLRKSYPLPSGVIQMNESGAAIMGESRQPVSKLNEAASLADKGFSKALGKQRMRS
jgi:hypothetical protein